MGSRRSRYRDDYSDGGYGQWPAYVSVAERKAKAARHAKALEKKSGRKLTPIKVQGLKIAKSFWGLAWCNNLEAYSDFANRLPRGKTYVRNGSVIDLQISAGKVKALVSGSEIYELSIDIDTLPAKLWQEIRRDCAQSISSLVNLLQGRFDRGVMDRLTQRDGGLFPKPKEIHLDCNCPDSAGLCKHLAAVMYGVGALLDTSPELLFTLRNVDHLELISQAVSEENLGQALAGESGSALADNNLSEMFGIDLETLTEESGSKKPTPPKGKRASKTRTAKAPPVAATTSTANKPTKSRAAKSVVAKIAADKPIRKRAQSAEMIEIERLAKAVMAKSKLAKQTTARSAGKKSRQESIASLVAKSKKRGAK